jgi:hypothetical protein
VRTDGPPQQLSRRPFGVVLLAFLWLFYGALAVLLVLDVPGVPPAGIVRPFATFGLLEPAAGVLAAISLVIALGLWFLQPWAWVLAMLLAGIGLASDIVAWFDGRDAYVSLLFGVVIAFYLNQAAVRRRFRIGIEEDLPAVTLADGERDER